MVEQIFRSGFVKCPFGTNPEKMNLPKSFKLKNQPAFCFLKRLETVAKSSAYTQPAGIRHTRHVLPVAQHEKPAKLGFSGIRLKLASCFCQSGRKSFSRANGSTSKLVALAKPIDGVSGVFHPIRATALI